MMNPGQGEKSELSLSLKRIRTSKGWNTEKMFSEKVFGLKHEHSQEGERILDKCQSSTFKQVFPYLKE